MNISYSFRWMLIYLLFSNNCIQGIADLFKLFFFFLVMNLICFCNILCMDIGGVNSFGWLSVYYNNHIKHQKKHKVTTKKTSFSFLHQWRSEPYIFSVGDKYCSPASRLVEKDESVGHILLAFLRKIALQWPYTFTATSQ